MKELAGRLAALDPQAGAALRAIAYFDRLGWPIRDPQGRFRLELALLRFDRETMELPVTDAQQIVVFLPADEATADAVNRLRASRPALRVAT
jgi:hypothetical protein